MRVSSLEDLPAWAQKQVREKLETSPHPLQSGKRGRPKVLKEKAFMQKVISLAHLHGWLCYHTHDSRRSAPGFPDLVMVREPRVVFAELKTDDGPLSQSQQDWKERLEECEGVSYYLWRPSHWQEIVSVMKGKL